NWNWSKAKPAGMLKVAGTGAVCGSLLVRVTTAPPAGAGPLSWSCTFSVMPPGGVALVESASETGVGGVAGTVNVPVADQAVLAGTPGAESPWVESTCQYFVPAESEVTLQCAPVIWLSTYSMFLKPASSAISSTYPDSCGLGTSVQVRLTGSGTVAPFAGVSSVGGGGNGALKERVKVSTLEGTPWRPVAL